MNAPMVPSHITDLVSTLAFHTSVRPNKVAYRFLDSDGQETGALTYRELSTRACALAAELSHHQVVGEPVVLAFPAGLDFLVAFFGTLWAGGIAVPVCPPRKAASSTPFDAIVTSSGARVGLSTRGLLASKGRALERAGAGISWLTVDTGDGSAESTASAVITEAQVRPIALLQYTSGSTGAAKGTVISHANILANERMVARAFAQSSESVFVGWLPHYHDMGLIGNLLQPFYLGGTCVFMAPESFVQRPALWLEAISRYRGTTAGGPNFAFELCAARIEQLPAAVDLSCWELAFVGAEPVRATTLDRFCEKFASRGFRRQTFYPCYGLAEATLFVSGATKGAGYVSRGDDARAREATAQTRDAIGCGHEWGTSIGLVDPATGAACEPGQTGEIRLSGPCIAQGYWNNPQASAEAFDLTQPDRPVLRTGDLGVIENGQLYIVGRLKNVIIVAGKNFYAEDIEQAVSAISPMLESVAAVGIDTPGGEEVALVCELRKASSGSPAIDELAERMRVELWAALALTVPRIVFVRTRSLPKTTSGKLRHAAIREALLRDGLLELGRSELRHEPPFSERALVAAQLGDTEAWLVDTIAGLVGLAPSAVHKQTPFAALGLESRDLLSIVAELGNRLAIELDPALLWECPTVADVLAHLEDELQGGAASMGTGAQA